MTALAAPPRAWWVAGARVAGPGHVRRGVPCEDAYEVAASGDALVIAVADGMGSAPRAATGAGVAVAAAARAGGALLEAAPDAPPPEVALQALACARLALEREAGDRGVALGDLACTLIVVVATGDRAAAAHVGDGAAIAETGDGLVLLSGPGAGEYVEVTDPLTAGDWHERVRVSPVVGDVRAVAALTDGLQRAALAPGWTPSDGFLGPLLDFARGGRDTVSVSDAFGRLLEGPKLSEHSDDDKTIVVAVR